ncbi:MAG TPA: hypothetical protein VM370_10190 [Candidatus Thermoplasmatota archaeon]|nr:hypothetical protein [Candidatus Thermoplasmatota archaeon]
MLAASLVAMFAFGAFAAPAATAEVTKYVLVLDTPEGIIEREVTQSEVDIMLTCSADAPTVASCVNGPATRVSAAGHGLLLPIPSGFSSPAGTVPVHKMIFTSFLRSNAATERVFRCEVTETPAPAGTGAIAFTCFPGAGGFPPVGSAMTQEAVGLLATQGGAADTTSLQVYQATGGDVVLAGLGKFSAQLTY